MGAGAGAGVVVWVLVDADDADDMSPSAIVSEQAASAAAPAISDRASGNLEMRDIGYFSTMIVETESRGWEARVP